MKKRFQFAIFARPFRFKKPDCLPNDFQGIVLANDQKDATLRYCANHNNVWVSAVEIPDGITINS